MHMRQLPSGRWHWRVIVDGRRRSGTEDTKTSAKRAALEASYELGREPAVERVSLAELLDSHLAQHKYAPTTLADFRSLLKRLPDDVGAWIVRDMTPATVEGLYRRLARDGWSGHRLRRLHTLLSSAFTRARRWGWASVNVVRDVPAPAVAVTQVRPPSLDEVRQVLAVVDGQVGLALRVAAVTGARRGELVGLQWADINFDASQVVIRRSVAHTTTGVTVGEGKTGTRGHRVVALDAATVAALRAHCDWQQTLARDSLLPAPVWVFSHDAGLSPWRGDYFSHQFVKACRRAGVSGVRLHDIRHFVATTMLTSDVPLQVVAGRLGHSTRVLSEVYSHFIAGADKAATDVLGSALNER